MDVNPSPTCLIGVLLHARERSRPGDASTVPGKRLRRTNGYLHSNRVSSNRSLCFRETEFCAQRQRRRNIQRSSQRAALLVPSRFNAACSNAIRRYRRTSASNFAFGINLGDIICEGTDIFGDGVNVAARLESIADRGGICISRQVLDQVEGKLDVPFRELGRQNLKNIAKPVEAYTIQLDAATSPGSRFLANARLKQEIRYCKASDGVRLAYATVGDGPPMLKSAHWMGHLEYDWELPISRHLLLGLSKDHTLIPVRCPRQRPIGLGRTRDFPRCALRTRTSRRIVVHLR
jgi:hypothetical protein